MSVLLLLNTPLPNFSEQGEGEVTEGIQFNTWTSKRVRLLLWNGFVSSNSWASYVTLFLIFCYFYCTDQLYYTRVAKNKMQNLCESVDLLGTCECLDQRAATNEEEDDMNRGRDLSAADESTQMSLVTFAEDIEMQKLFAYFAQILNRKKKVEGNPTLLAQSTIISSIHLPPPVIFKRKKPAASNRPAVEHKK